MGDSPWACKNLDTTECTHTEFKIQHLVGNDERDRYDSVTILFVSKDLHCKSSRHIAKEILVVKMSVAFFPLNSHTPGYSF